MWQWASQCDSRTLELKQLNGIKSSSMLLVTVLFLVWHVKKACKRALALEQLNGMQLLIHLLVTPAVTSKNKYLQWGRPTASPVVKIFYSLYAKKHVHWSVHCVCVSVWLKFQYLWQRWLEWRRAGWRSCPRSQLRTQTKTSQVGSLRRLSGITNPRPMLK